MVLYRALRDKSGLSWMLRIGKLSDYAILLMVELQATRQGLLSAHSLSDRAHLELPTASKLLKLLAQAGLVTSSRGIHGGYKLARPATGINVAEIIAAIEGPIARLTDTESLSLRAGPRVRRTGVSWPVGRQRSRTSHVSLTGRSPNLASPVFLCLFFQTLRVEG